eukprot:CAMPEP_0180128656 /NCGR_PEP_ID=MMETSP0986-20121125/6892_1 /TAXON_ID=697907 /ORGANISM="non described non described, Strain CCMP2293" /LENGTH=204 /DNA_ID=CAMNT_0022068259 /DNA_START=6 /DNA_END=617 /DNA_ORIENTATION=+
MAVLLSADLASVRKNALIGLRSIVMAGSSEEILRDTDVRRAAAEVCRHAAVERKHALAGKEMVRLIKDPDDAIRRIGAEALSTLARRGDTRVASEAVVLLKPGTTEVEKLAGIEALSGYVAYQAETWTDAFTGHGSAPPSPIGSDRGDEIEDENVDMTAIKKRSKQTAADREREKREALMKIRMEKIRIERLLKDQQTRREQYE